MFEFKWRRAYFKKTFSYLLNVTRTMFLFFNTPFVKTEMYVSLLFLLGEFPYKSDRMFRLALGSEFQILVSLGVFGMERHYICPFRYRLGLSVKKLTKNTVISLRVSLSLSHTHIGLLLILRRASPSLLYGSSPRGKILTASAHMSLLVMWICFFFGIKTGSLWCDGH